MKPGIRDLHRFVRGNFKRQLLTRYKKLMILTEADLQAYAFELLRKFFRLRDPMKKRFRVLNKPYFREINMYPDIAVFKRGRPWVLFELKERSNLSPRIAGEEREGLLIARQKLDPPPRRGYLLYVARAGKKRALKGPKGEAARYFFEVPIVLPHSWPKARKKAWERDRKKWTKYVSRAPST